MLWQSFPEPQRCVARGQVAMSSFGRVNDLYPAHNTKSGDGRE